MNIGDTISLRDLAALEPSMHEAGGQAYAVTRSEDLSYLLTVDEREAKVSGIGVLGSDWERFFDDIRSGRSDERARRFEAYMEAEITKGDAVVGPIVRPHGFLPSHTGGGCLAWQISREDDSDREVDEYLLTNGAVDLHGSEEPAEWVIGRYLDDHCIVVAVATVAEAMAVFPYLPEPEDDLSFDGAAAFDEWLASRPGVARKP